MHIYVIGLLSFDVFLIVICFRIIYKECIRQKSIKQENINVYQIQHDNVYQKFLNIWSKSAMIIATLSLIVSALETIETICKYALITCHAMWALCKILVTFYQISRLQYCLGQDQIHSSYGYSKWWFIFLYVNGFLLILCGLFINISTFFISEWSFQNDFCLEKTGIVQRVYFPIAVFYYLIWDWTVLLCYCIKIRQFYQKQSSKVPEDVLKRIKFILQRILFLTVILELHGIILSVIITGSIVTDSVFVIEIIRDIFARNDLLITVFITSLMVEHNTDKYIKFIKILDKCKLFIFCGSFVNDAMRMENSLYNASSDRSNVTPTPDTNASDNKHEDTVFETNTMPPPPDKPKDIIVTTSVASNV